jgi:hypothetical protein
MALLRRRKAAKDDSERVTNEIKRQHQLVWATADSLDVKNGVILGFIILILVQIILSGQITNDFSKSIVLLTPFVPSAQYWLNLASFTALFGALISLIAAAYIGANTIKIRQYHEAEIEGRFAEYRAGNIDAATFDKSVSKRLLDDLPLDKQNSKKKVAGAKITLLLFILGITLLIAHFAVIVISTSFFS